MPLVSSVKSQPRLPKSLLVSGRCLDRVMFCLKPFDFNDLNDHSLKPKKYFMFPDSHLGFPRERKNAVSISVAFCLDFLIRNEDIASEECKTKNHLK